MRRCIYRQTDRRTERRTLDRLWYEINIPYFSNEKAGIISICTFRLNVRGKGNKTVWSVAVFFLLFFSFFFFFFFFGGGGVGVISSLGSLALKAL